jgi:hypothetical protein
MGTLALPFVVLVGLAPVADGGETEVIVNALKSQLARKGKVFPYWAEYYLALPPAPRMSGATEKRRYSATERGVFYAEEVRETDTSRVLVQKQKLQGEYADRDVTDFYTANLRLDGGTAEAWLRAHGFWILCYETLDKDLVSFVTELVKDAQVVRSKDTDGKRCFTLRTSQLGELEFTISLMVFEMVSTVADKKSKKRWSLKYTYGDGQPLWKIDPQKELLDKIRAADSEQVHSLKGDVTKSTIFDQLFGQPWVNRTVTLDEARRHARRYCMLFPKGDASQIRKASTYQQTLTLEIAAGGKVYSITQWPPSRRGSDDIKQEPGVRKRKFKDYEVLGVDYGIYYTSKDADFGFDATGVSFNDPNPSIR